MERLKLFFKNVRRTFHKLQVIDGSLNSHRLKGKFKVIYSDGAISQPFDWRTANDYAEAK